MTEANDGDTIVTAASGTVNYPGGSAPAVLFRLVGFVLRDLHERRLRRPGRLGSGRRRE